MIKVNFYIDGYNLYYGLKSKSWQKYYWLNIEKLCKKIILKSQTLNKIKYFTARISSPPDKVKRQSTYLEAIQTLNNVEIIEGVYYSNPPFTCSKCKSKYLCKCNFPLYDNEEKRTDVNIAVNMICDALTNEYEVAYLISGDSDLIPIMEKIKIFFLKKKIVVYFPPNRFSNALKQKSDAHKFFYESVFKDSQFPDALTNKFGYQIQRPNRWK